MILRVKDLYVSKEDKKIVSNVSFDLDKGKTLVILGPNGAGKSTVAKALTGYPGFDVSGNVVFKNKNLFELNVGERAKLGLFMSFQHPPEVPGITVSSFIRSAMRAKGFNYTLKEYISLLNKSMSDLGINSELASRSLNYEFSGGEKKKLEMLQMVMLKPELVILDETDSGLDVDSLKNVCDNINTLKTLNKDLSLIIITHYKRMLDYLDVDEVLIMIQGKILKRGGKDLVDELEKNGFEAFRK